MNDEKEKAFTRALLRRLNVIFAKAKPKGGLAELLNGAKLSDAFEGKQTNLKEVKKHNKPTEQKALVVQVVKPKEKPKIDLIVEQEMKPPELPNEILDG